MDPRTSRRRRGFGCDTSVDDSCTQSSLALDEPPCWTNAEIPSPYLSGLWSKNVKKAAILALALIGSGMTIDAAAPI
jgi:hypothetical protein